MKKPYYSVPICPEIPQIRQDPRWQVKDSAQDLSPSLDSPFSVTSYINRHAVPILKKYLEDDRLSLTQISEMMNFTSLSYFSRYCNKHLGQSPSAYRLSLQPRNLHRRFPEVAENM